MQNVHREMQNAIKLIEATLANASRASSDVAEIIEHEDHFVESWGDDFHEVYGDRQSRLIDVLNDAARIFLVTYEIAGLQKAYERFFFNWQNHSRNLISFGSTSEGDAYNIPLNFLYNELFPLRGIVIGVPVVDDPTSAHAALKNVLKSTPALLKNFNINPTREHDVYNPIRSVLRGAFPDLVPVHIALPMKTYKPEFGIRSLRSVIEYKFAVDEADCAKKLDEVAADIRGYMPNDEWQHFYLVLYLTNPGVSLPVIEAHVQQLRFPDYWTVFPVIGTGGRVPKAKGKPKKAAKTKPPAAKGSAAKQITVAATSPHPPKKA